MLIATVRKNIGTFITSLGFFLLCILTFGNLAEIGTEEYWINVGNNLTSIGLMSLSLTTIQTVIKQGICEQALQRGLNSENTTIKYQEHRALIKSSTERLLYLPYFLQIYNKRHTMFLRREFLVANSYSSEEAFFKQASQQQIKKYNDIYIRLTLASLKWATVDLIYTKHGQLQTLSQYRTRRLLYGFGTSIIMMLALSFVTEGLFLSVSEEPFIYKIVKLLTYLIVIAITSVYAIIKEYEKGAFGIPNELDEINAIWTEFQLWNIPEWVLKEVEVMNNMEEPNEGKNNRTNIQVEQKKEQDIPRTREDDTLDVSTSDDSVLLSNGTELGREHN